MVTKSSWSTSLKVRQEKTDLDAGKEEDGDAIVDFNDVMEEEFAEERRLLCSPSEPSQLARQVHTVGKNQDVKDVRTYLSHLVACLSVLMVEARSPSSCAC